MASPGTALVNLGRPTSAPPASAPDGADAVEGRRWVRALLVPLELLALAWGLPIVILLLLSPIAAAFWLGRMLLAIF
jgi:hypothetical protein